MRVGAPHDWSLAEFAGLLNRSKKLFGDKVLWFNRTSPERVLIHVGLSAEQDSPEDQDVEMFHEPKAGWQIKAVTYTNGLLMKP